MQNPQQTSTSTARSRRLASLLAAGLLAATVGGQSLAQSNPSAAKTASATASTKTASNKTTASKTASNTKTANAKSAARRRPKPKPPEIPIEKRPYKVRVSVVFGQSTILTPAFRQRILREIENGVDRSYGQMWQLDVRENFWLPLCRKAGLEMLTTEGLLARFLPDKPGARMPFDKLFVVTVERAGPRFTLAGREWDSKSRTSGPTETTATSLPREVGRKLFSLLPRLFHPVLQIDKVTPVTVELRYQAAEFPAVDPAVAQVKVGDIVVPYFRYFDKSSTLQRIRSVPWTYISIESIKRQHIKADLIMDRVGRLGTGRTRGVEILASVIRPQHKSSRLTMVYQTDVTKPLAGYNVHLIAKKFYRDRPVTIPILLYSNRDGGVDVPVFDGFPIVWVYVYSGAALLARVPYVPGVTDTDLIELPDDSLRLGVEGKVALLKGRLIDIVAQRVTLMALAKQIDLDTTLSEKRRTALRKNKRDLINALEGIPEFEALLEGICTGPRIQAEKLGNRFATMKIKRLERKTLLLIRNFLSKEDVEKFFKSLNGETEE